MQVEASIFARVLQDIEDRCLGCVRRVLQGEGWLARSWQQDGLLVEDMEGRQLRGGGGGGVPAVERLEAAMRNANLQSVCSVVRAYHGRQQPAPLGSGVATPCEVASHDRANG